MSGDIVMWKMDMFITSDRASFLLILYQFLQYYVFVVLSCDAFATFHRYFYCDSSFTHKYQSGRHNDDCNRDVVYTFIKITYFTATITSLTSICVIVVSSCSQLSFINIIW